MTEIFGQRVRVAMAAARISRRDLARACEVTPQAVKRWCDGTSYPTSRNLMTLTALTGASLEWLMWPHPVNLTDTEWALGGVHIKNIIRQAVAGMRAEE